jgi:tetratricopeptide (TPR) repeat protein
MNDVVPLLKFTPSAQDPDVLEAITVQREPLIAALVESALGDGAGLRHQLLVGPRGIGKTHVLSVVANRIEADDRADAVVLARLDEDPWPIRTYDKFLAAIAAQVATASDDAALSDEAAMLRSGASGEAGEEMLRRALGTRRLVLLAENLDEIFRRIGPEGQARFRAFAEDWRQLLILATAPQLFTGVRRHTSPFYGFFAVSHLDELSLENAVELLRRIARQRGDTALIEFLGTETASQRLRAVQALAGGHPRIWLLLAGCISVAAIDELVPLFIEALDDLTPYYQDRLRSLGDQQQEAIVLLAEAGGALSNRALAERSGIPQNQIATMLRQLDERGYVRRAELPAHLATGDKRMSYWELREPLMRLCLDVKQARGKPLRIVVEFLRAWYGPRLLDELVRLPASAHLAAAYANEAFRTLAGPLGPDALLRGSPAEILARAEVGLSLVPEHSGLQMAKATGLIQEHRYSEARDLLTGMLAEADAGPGRFAVRFQLATAQEVLGEPVDSDALRSEARALQGTSPTDVAVAAAVAYAYARCGIPAETVHAWDAALELDPHRAAFHHARGVALQALGRYDDALAAHTRAVEIDPDEPESHEHLSILLTDMGRHGDALVAATKAAELAPDSPRLHLRRALALTDLNRNPEALDAVAKAIELEPQEGLYHDVRALIMSRHGHDEDALVALSRAVELQPHDAMFHAHRGLVLLHLSRLEEALAAYTRATELAPDNPDDHSARADVLRLLGRKDQAIDAALHAVQLDEERAAYRFVLVETLLSAGKVEQALDQLREALAAWSRDRAEPPGNTGLSCRILWERFPGDARRRELIAQIVSAYDEVDAGDELGRGVVTSIPLFVGDDVDQRAANAWVDDWSQAPPVPELEIPLRLLEAARAWKRDGDRAHLVALPAEQREILVRLLTP